MSNGQAFAFGLSGLSTLAGMILLIVGLLVHHVEQNGAESDLPRPSIGYGFLLVAIGATVLLLAMVPYQA